MSTAGRDLGIAEIGASTGIGTRVATWATAAAAAVLLGVGFGLASYTTPAEAVPAVVPVPALTQLGELHCGSSQQVRLASAVTENPLAAVPPCATSAGVDEASGIAGKQR